MKERRQTLTLAEKFKIAEAIKANLEMFTQRRMNMYQTAAELEKILKFPVSPTSVRYIKKQLGIEWAVVRGKNKSASPKLQLFARALFQLHDKNYMEGETLAEIKKIAGVPE